MLQKITGTIKNLLKSWLNKIEKIEQKISLKKKLKPAVKREPFLLPEWLLLLLIILTFIIGIITRNFIIPKVFDIRLLIFVLLSSFIIVYFIVKIIFRNILIKTITVLNIKSEEYNNSFVLFLTLTILHVFFIIFFEIYNINLYLLPTVGLVMLVSMLLNIWWAVGFIFFNSFIGNFLYVGLTSEVISYSVFFILSSMYILTLIEKVHSRQDIIYVISKSVIINFIISTCLYILISSKLDNFLSLRIKVNPFIKTEDINVVYFVYTNFIGGIINWSIVTILLSPLELIYQRTTNIKLIELSNFNHPLLKKLMTEAPGTYHHSLMVSSLAEAVASKLGLNSLLCKVGGYYHDIGKIIQPEYFIENQFAIQNPHSEINPSLSALVIINHVKEGVKLAKEYKIDKQVIDIIEQHHGNSLIHGLYLSLIHI